ncbi:MAG: hypothetical protein RIM72_05255 [Alphaproteobacteria bacterium]
MSLVRLSEIDPRLHLSHETDRQTPVAAPEPLSRVEIRAAVERGHALRAKYIGEIAKNACRRIGELIDKAGNRLRSGHFTAHSAR